MPSTYIGAWQDDIARLGTLSCTVPDSAYPAANAQDDNPANVAKATSTTATWTSTPGGSHTLRALAIINHNWVGRTVNLVSSAGTIQAAVPIPARVGGQCTNVWLDVAGLSNLTGTTFSLVLSGGSGNPAVGRILLFTTLDELRWQYGVEHGQRFPATRMTTFGESDHIYAKGIRRRFASGVVHGEPENREMLIELHNNIAGELRPFLYVQDSDVNDCWWSRMDADALAYGIPDYGYEQLPLAFTEVSMGLPL